MNWTVIFQKGCNSLFDWGPGMLIAALMLYGAYKLVLKLSKGAGVKIIMALEKPAEALNRQAQSMDRLTTSIQEYVETDRDEHKEIIILQKVIREEIREIRVQNEEILHGRREDGKTPQN